MNDEWWKTEDDGSQMKLNRGRKHHLPSWSKWTLSLLCKIPVHKTSHTPHSMVCMDCTVLGISRRHATKPYLYGEYGASSCCWEPSATFSASLAWHQNDLWRVHWYGESVACVFVGARGARQRPLRVIGSGSPAALAVYDWGWSRWQNFRNPCWCRTLSHCARSHHWPPSFLWRLLPTHCP